MGPSDISPEDISERTQREIPSIVKSLEVEQLDPTLFRSTSLHRPWRARGVYGGHVISQALVSATRSVDEVYHLHVRSSLM
jgi:acyl-CoA thioesterase